MKILNLAFTLLAIIFLAGSVSAQDWPNTARFKADNEKIGLPQNGEKRIVFMGNSITEGWIRLCPDFFANKPYVNRGISGQT
ncbi:MAG: hypothetical protein K0M50_21200, partial [Prolixibacteraceae bacterium]|nr:hypothetical protein [Prolixibacteraceae bacterium]